MAAFIEYEMRFSDKGNTHKKAVLVTFTHGKLSTDEAGKYTNAPDCSLYTATDDRKKDRNILVAKGESMDYVGQSYGTLAPSNACKYLVGALNKSTGKMKVLDAQFFRLHPWVKKVEDEEERDRQVKRKKDRESQSFAAKTDLLTEAFGSTRKRRAMESRVRNKIEAESLEKSATDAAKHAKHLPELPNELTTAQEGILPPCDKTAVNPADIFKLDDILLPGLREALEDQANFLIKASKEEIAEWRQKERYPKYILQQIPMLSAKVATKAQEDGACLVFIMLLMKMHMLRVRVIKTSVPSLEDQPLVIHDFMIKNFTELTVTPNGKTFKRCVSKKMKDKMVVYILLLAQHVDNFRTSLEPLQMDLGITQKILLKYVHSVGGKYYAAPVESSTDQLGSSKDKSKEKQYIMELKGPLALSKGLNPTKTRKYKR